MDGIPSGFEYATGARLEFVRRLLSDWRDLAIALEMPAYDVSRLEHGNEAHGIWFWLEARHRLQTLPDALELIGRTDLANELKRQAATARHERRAHGHPAAVTSNVADGTLPSSRLRTLRPTRWVFAAYAVAAAVLAFLGYAAADRLNVPGVSSPWAWAAGATLMVAVATVFELRRSAFIRTHATSALYGLADELARSIHVEWGDEAAHRRLYDPFPMTVGWEPADEDLFASWDSIVRLATTGPGWPTGHPEAWAPDRTHLRGVDDQLVDVLARVPTGRLVLLGEPGAGKSILLVRLVLDLLIRRQPGAPVPVLLQLSSWDPTRLDLLSWIEDTLRTDHPVLARKPPGVSTMTGARALLSAGLLLFVLDGLDEMPDEARELAITRINAALRPGQRLVLSARTTEYRSTVLSAAGVPLHLAGCAGVEIRPLEPSVVRDFLTATGGGSRIAGDRWETVVATLTSAPASAVAQALTTPLAVSLARVVYNLRTDPEHHGQRDPNELLDEDRFHTPEAITQHLIAHFVPAAYAEPTPGSRHRGWSAEQATRWLGFLARDLVTRQSGTRLAWWELRAAAPRWLPALTVGAVSCLISAPLFPFVGPGVGFICAFAAGFLTRRLTARSVRRPSLTAGLIGGISGGLTGGVVALSLFGPGQANAHLASYVAGTFIVGVIVAPLGRPLPAYTAGSVGQVVIATYEQSDLLEAARTALAPFTHLLNGAGVGLAAGAVVGLLARHTPARRLSWSLAGATCGLLIGIIVGVVTWLQVGTAGGLLVGVAASTAMACAGGVLFEPAAIDLEKTTSPRAALQRDRTTFLTCLVMLGTAVGVTIGSAVVYSLNPNTGDVYGPRVGVGIGVADFAVCGLAFAFVQASWGTFFLARLWLAATRRLPWRLMAFLHDAHVNRGVLRQSGAAYEFRHLTLQLHLATKPVEQPHSARRSSTTW